MILIDIDDLFRIIMYVVLIVGVPVLCVQLFILLKRTSSVMSDVKVITEKAAVVSEDPEAVKQFTQDVASYTANDVIDKQSEKAAKQLTAGILKLIGR